MFNFITCLNRALMGLELSQQLGQMLSVESCRWHSPMTYVFYILWLFIGTLANVDKFL